ncbi:MAG: alpha/beta hydrolase, partial [Peptostreptococcaceae bacterium]
IVLIILLIIVIFIIVFATNFVIKETLMSKRKDYNLMIEELSTVFGIDYKNYETIPKEEISIKSHDNLTLKGYYHNVNPNSKKVVIINHGYTANHYVAYQFTDIFFEEGYNVLLIDMRSHGQSEGVFVSYGYNESKDIDKWVKWVKRKIGSDAYIGLHGQSMGAATMLLYGGSHENEVKFVISDCGFSTAKDAIKFQFKQAKVPFFPLYDLARLKIKRKFNFDFNKISPKDIIANSNIPVMFIHGIRDSIVPVWMSEDMYNSKKGPKDMIYIAPNANHVKSYTVNKEEYKSKIKLFLNNL